MIKKTVPAAIVLAAALATAGAPAANATYSDSPATTKTVSDTKTGAEKAKPTTGGKHETVKDIHGVIWHKIFTWTKFGWVWKWVC